MVESTCFQHTSSHPDKYNNSVNRIISKEEEREDIQGEILQSSFQLESKSELQWCLNIQSILQELQCFHTQSSNSKFPQLILHTESILPQEILQLQGSSHADHYKASPNNCSRVSKHSTWQNKAPGSPTAFQAHTAEAGFQLILPSRNSTPSGSQHPRSPYYSSQANFTRIHLVLQEST